MLELADCVTLTVTAARAGAGARGGMGGTVVAGRVGSAGA